MKTHDSSLHENIFWRYDVHMDLTKLIKDAHLSPKVKIVWKDSHCIFQFMSICYLRIELEPRPNSSIPIWLYNYTEPNDSIYNIYFMTGSKFWKIRLNPIPNHSKYHNQQVMAKPGIYPLGLSSVWLFSYATWVINDFKFFNMYENACLNFLKQIIMNSKSTKK